MKKIILALIISVTALIACKKKDSEYTIDKTSLSLKVGERHQFVVKFNDDPQKVEYFDWTSSNMSVGNVNGSGQIHAAGAEKNNC